MSDARPAATTGPDRPGTVRADPAGLRWAVPPGRGAGPPASPGRPARGRPCLRGPRPAWPAPGRSCCWCIDGLGAEQLRTRTHLSPVLSGGDGQSITSVAPSTTACALTTLVTGRAAGRARRRRVPGRPGRRRLQRPAVVDPRARRPHAGAGPSSSSPTAVVPRGDRAGARGHPVTTTGRRGSRRPTSARSSCIAGTPRRAW